MKKLLKEVLSKNIDLINSNLTIQTFGNLSLRLNENEIAIKPSGADLESLELEDISIVDMNGKHISGLTPSVDTPTHIFLYNNYAEINSIVHTHSQYATSWAQALYNIPNLGTTHSDYIMGEVYCTRALREEEIQEEYEKNTGVVIKETLKKQSVEIYDLPGILVGQHGLFSWGKNMDEAFNNAEIIEYIAKLAYLTKNINPKAVSVNSYLNIFHFQRKHGKNSYYGQ